MIRKVARRYIGIYKSGPSTHNESITIPETKSHGNYYKKGPKRKMIVRKPKPVAVDLLEISEKDDTELSAIIPHEEPIDNLKVEAKELRDKGLANIEIPKSEQHPSKPNRRLFRKFESFEVEHFPAASQADFTPSKLFDTYRDVKLAPGEIQMTLPRASSVPSHHSSRLSFSTHNENAYVAPANQRNMIPLKFNQSPASRVGASFWVKHNRDKSVWEKDPLANTWDMLLDEPTNPLLAAPITTWESLPLDSETIPADEIRDESKPREVEVDGHKFEVTPNEELDILPVSITPKPNHWYKQYGMPMDKAIGPIQWEHEPIPASKMIRSVKQGSLKIDPNRDGQEMKILCVGDSLTLGLTVGSDKSHIMKGSEMSRINIEDEELEPREHPYALRLQKLLNANIDILGVPRDTTDLMRDRMLLKVKEQHEAGTPYDLVIIWGGVWDLYDPDVTGHEVALNLTRMHHVCHMYGAKTLAMTLPQLPSRPLGKHMMSRILDINAELEEFARDRRAQMKVVDIHRLIPYSSGTFKVSLGHNLSEPKSGKVYTPIWHTSSIEMTPLGYDRVGELVYKKLKHSPGFIQKAIADRFYDHPCNETHHEARVFDKIRDAEFLAKTKSRVRARANASSYGSTYHNKRTPWKDHTGTKLELDDHDRRMELAYKNTTRVQHLLTRTPRTAGHSGAFIACDDYMRQASVL
eukprot:TRINITY_DN1373_c1_g1_i3.p1 TRINITY_DN1373_c1_g1~~TRINITY_DN1373_c1_g1_i3.p1  ORF type:complete len:694 (+),score=67.94 TRINITY_DN1373_c1_g1_i3:824-2905(+)